ncbi:EAL domain-containing protein [Piscinibacter sakaiensis]|uniref:putative bifunctional diguanylate cyclase/phosphodiesterase n=1 Tax=Piscinibacter sakaiensis TaxID=1547922 RepID=UPI00372CBA69
MKVAYLSGEYHGASIVAAYLIAVFASFVSFGLTQRVAGRGLRAQRLWWAAGSLVFGTGVWSMHFIAMLGFDLGIPVGYREGRTLLSWVVAVAAATVGLGIARRTVMTPGAHLLGSVVMAAGISAMHYIGMSALEFHPGVVWLPGRVVASVLIALVASAIALHFCFNLKRIRGPRAQRAKLAASLIMGAAICGLHYVGMSAMQVPMLAICLSADGLGGHPLSVIVATCATLIMGSALLSSHEADESSRRERALNVSLTRANDDLRSAHAALELVAFADPLTGLPNRAVFHDRMAHAIARIGERARAGTPADDELGLLHVDVDGFKAVNDSLGHEAGDVLLREIAARLRQAARQADTVSRMAGDQFVILVEGPQAALHGLQVARGVLSAFGRPFRLTGQDTTLSCSIGLALFPGDADRADRLVALADTAMRAAKAVGGSSFRRYDPGMGSGSLDPLLLGQELRLALARGELLLHYQPKVCARTGRLHGVEALVRWQHPERGLVSPGLFVPVAERFGLIGALGHWVLEEACRQAVAWREAGIACRVAVNVSPQQFRNPAMLSEVAEVIARSGMDPADLVCEITETALVESIGSTQRLLDALRAMGIGLSIDDFGTGYSSLAHLRAIPVQQLKIDKSFVDDIATSTDARALVEGIIQLAHALRLEVVAEGVETEAQWRTLQRAGCDVVQGYHIGRPMPADELRRWMAQRRVAPGAAVTAALPAAEAQATPGSGCGRPPKCSDQPSWSPASTLSP